MVQGAKIAGSIGGVALGSVNDIPVALADEQRRLRKLPRLSGVVAVIVADGDVLDLRRSDLELREEIREVVLGAVAAAPTGLPVSQMR